MYKFDLPLWAPATICGQAVTHIGNGEFISDTELGGFLEIILPKSEADKCPGEIVQVPVKHPLEGNTEPRKRVLILAQVHEGEQRSSGMMD